MVTADEVSFSLPTAQQVMEKVALAEAEKASAAASKHAAAEAEKKGAQRQAHQAVRRFGVVGASRGGGHHRTRRIERPYRGSGLSLSECDVHGSWPCHQSAGDGLGTDAHQPAEGDVQVLGAAASAARIQA